MPENNVPLSEQAHWKNRNPKAPAKPMSAGARFAIFAIIAAIAGGGFYGFGKYKDHMNGSKEITMLGFDCAVSGLIIFKVPSKDIGDDEDDDGTSYIFMSAPDVDVALRGDGKNFTTALFSHRSRFAADHLWERVTVLVPSERDLQIWREFLEQARVRHDLYIRSEQEKYKPRRVLPGD